MLPQYSIVTEPAAQPVSYADAAAHLRVDSTDDMDYINGLVAVAREYVDSITSRASSATTWKLTAERWLDLFETDFRVDYIDPRLGLSGLSGSAYVIPLRRVPLISVSSIQYYAPDSASQTTLDTSKYRVVTAAEPGLVQLTEAPPQVDDRVDAIEIEFTAGSQPTAIQQHAIKIMVAHLYENRMPVAFASCEKLPFSLETLLFNQKQGGWF